MEYDRISELLVEEQVGFRKGGQFVDLIVCTLMTTIGESFREGFCNNYGFRKGTLLIGKVSRKF